MKEMSQDTLKIAFASSNQSHLDEHFGSCQSLSIYSVSTTSYEHIDTHYLTQYEGHNLQKIEDRLAALEGCFAVYCLACGNPVRQRLLTEGIRVVVRPQTDLISAVIVSIQANWPGKIAQRQARQIQRKNQTDYFDKLADSEWE